MKECKYKCKEIKKIMIDDLSQEFTHDDPLFRESIAIMENHLKSCDQCRREYQVLQSIHRDTRQIEAEANAVMATIDWKENARDITQGLRFKFKRSGQTWSFPFQPLNWKWVVPTLATIFILGLWLGYLLFNTTSQVVPKNL